jgi:hypothetical protein
MKKITHILAASCLKIMPLMSCVVTVLPNSSALAEQSSLPYAKGGFSASFGQLARAINQSGELFRIEGRCQSSCTMFLSLRKVCVDRNAVLLFHSGKRLGAVGGKERMLNTYHAKLREFLIANHYMDTPEFHAISGHDIIQKFGYRACPQK